MLDQRRRRWADVVQMLFKCFVFAGGKYNITDVCLSTLARECSVADPMLV